MTKLYLYAIFHGNLNFSYITRDLYPQILNNCYWPLLRIIEEQQVPLGLEMSAYTLEEVGRLDPGFVRRLGELWREGACEFVGSGYVQSIMPLMPAMANRQNLRHGNQVYQELLGRTPSMAFVNEQVYSAGLPWIYRQEGYQTLIVNWDSSNPALEHPELLYRPCAVSDGRGGQVPIVWHCTATYRELQKYVEDEISLDDYLRWLDSYIPEEEVRALPIYSSDWEVFDFKPWDPYPDGFPHPHKGEMDKVAQLLALLKQHKEIELVSPTSLLSRFPDLPMVSPESSDYPLPYKKQHLHPMTRWSVGGRDSVRLNTQCYRLYQELYLLERYAHRERATTKVHQEISGLWRELCFLWNSDFRTFTTEEKYDEFRHRMGVAMTGAARLKARFEPQAPGPGQVRFTNHSSSSSQSHPVSFTLPANGAGENGHLAYEIQLNNQSVPCQVTRSVPSHSGTRNLTLEAIPSISPTQSEIGTLRKANPCPTHEGYQVDPQRHLIETPEVSLLLLPQYGGGIQSLTFPKVSQEPLIKCAESAKPLAAGPEENLIPGDLTLTDWLGRSINDHLATDIHYPDAGERCELFVPVRCQISTELGRIWKTYRVYLHQPRVDLMVRFQWRDVVPICFRLGQMLLNAASFDRSTLYYATTNGGEDVERFLLANQYVRHSAPLHQEVTARGCLGATEGWVVLGDSNRGLGFITQPGALYSSPMVHYEEAPSEPGGFRLSLVYSLGERDETSHILWRGHSTWNLSIIAGQQDIVEQTRASGLLTNGGLQAWSEMGSNFQDQR